jgi:flavodoxin
MRVGIILFSETGNTYSVAKKIKDQIKNKDVTIEKIEVERTDGNRSHFNITFKPRLDDYNIIILGSFTEGFQLNPVMKSYLEYQNLKDKKVMCFITHHFPFPWLGGNSALKQMVAICEKKQAEVISTGVISWSNKKRVQNIDDLVNKFVQLI